MACFDIKQGLAILGLKKGGKKNESKENEVDGVGEY